MRLRGLSTAAALKCRVWGLRNEPRLSDKAGGLFPRWEQSSKKSQGVSWGISPPQTNRIATALFFAVNKATKLAAEGKRWLHQGYRGM